MKKIIVIGCPGSGKSTFSRMLGNKTGIEVFHLDNLFWNEDKSHVSQDVFDERLEKVLSGNEWIIDGNYGRTLERRLECCDAVFFFDVSTEVCLEGVRERQGKQRSDIPWTGNEDDGEFLEFIKNFNSNQRDKILELLSDSRFCGIEVHIFKTRTECNEFIAGLS